LRTGQKNVSSLVAKDGLFALNALEAFPPEPPRSPPDAPLPAIADWVKESRPVVAPPTTLFGPPSLESVTDAPMPPVDDPPSSPPPPQKDSVTSFALNGVKFIPSLMEMDPISFATSFYPATLLILNGAPKGNRNALKHGCFTAEARASRKEIGALARMARETLAAIE
jgi:hypothetical protein